MDLDFENMSREDLISANKRLYARVKVMENKKIEFDKRNKILSGRSCFIKNDNFIFRPKKTNIVKLVEKIILGQKIESGSIYGFRPIVPGYTWKVWVSSADHDFRWGFKDADVYYVVVKNKYYKLVLLSTIGYQIYEGLNNTMLPSYTFNLSVIDGDFEIKPGIKLSQIPLSMKGYGICYSK